MSTSPDSYVYRTNRAVPANGHDKFIDSEWRRAERRRLMLLCLNRPVARALMPAAPALLPALVPQAWSSPNIPNLVFVETSGAAPLRRAAPPWARCLHRRITPRARSSRPAAVAPQGDLNGA